MIDLVAEQSPFGGLERWLHDPSVTEVMVNAGRDIWVERSGQLQHVGHMRTSTLLAVIEHALAPTGRRLDRMHPMVDARLPDGSRVCAAIAPVAVDGPSLAIRRFATHTIPLGEFAAVPVVDVLASLVDARCNVVVSGATSSGKTTLLNALAQLVEPTSRVITLEDVAELRLHHPHVVRLETREATPDGVGDISLEHLLRTALRMRPDRLVVGEVRGAEAVHLLQALNTGHDGSLCTVHANSAGDALARLATLVLQGAGGWPLPAVHHHVARAVDAVVHVARQSDGTRRVVEVAEVVSPNGAVPALEVRPLVRHEQVLGSITRSRS